MKIEWQDYLSVGVSEIDQQHRLLFEKFNALLTASIEGKEASELNMLLRFLDSYTATHFLDEEHLMHRIGFPDAKNHKEDHLTFTRQISRLKDRILFEGAISPVVTSLCQTMTEWLIKHISGMDRAIGRFMEGKA